MSRSVLAMLALASFAACSSDLPPSADMRVHGTFILAGTTYAFDVSEWEPCEDCYLGGGDVLSSGALVVPSLSASSLPEGMQGITVGADLRDGLRVGEDHVTLEVGASGAKFEESTFSSPFASAAGVAVERIRFTGEPVTPWELTVRAKGQFSGNHREPKTSATFDYDGTLTYYPRCRRAGGVAEEAPILCGGFYGGGKLTQPTVDECPPELTAAFVPGTDIQLDEARGNIRYGDGEPFDCVFTEQNTFVCGTEFKDVKAAGCTWQVDVLVTDRLHVYGRANEGCAFEKPLCTTVFKKP